MADKIVKALFVMFGILLLAYLAMPSPDFPEQLPGSYQSGEPADVETPLRRGYYTDMTRSEVMNWYNRQFKWGPNLNYPPEEAQTIIRDQTKSTFLEEIVHPFRESIYVNGFEPDKPEYTQIAANGRQYRQKVIVRYVPSSRALRLLVGVLSLSLTYLLYKQYSSFLKKSRKT